MLVSPTAAVRPMRAGEEAVVARMLAAALADDPFIRWIAGTDPDRATAWMLAGLKMAERHGLVLVDETLDGAAVLMRPGSMPLPVRENLKLLPSLVRAVGVRRVPGVLRALTALEHAHPDEPHWTGLVLGVHPAAQGTGVGRRVIAAALDVVNDEPAYLEVCEGGPITLYARFGFATHARVTPGHGAPRMTTMWRDAITRRG
ncbi:GNAT family N-acetyltransferase [Solirubrobacter phytolaccae]|uniref:GNAT family N-acetyltransferase n=1 Tax=Solirubrobacter phytolaccae TaxID=1404360 RepID=A0A9X3NC09_9ACTN|nr:GNAT family N-acetyltransferase [Solirubrobacter phytolaccae]MDA0183196.1 GNAT family N-acetyltransferase [Solirubrobacter phytolaccae]